jgi:hypothetical protein
MHGNVGCPPTPGSPRRFALGNALTEMARKQTLGVCQADGRIAPEPTMDVNEVGEAIAHMANLPLNADNQDKVARIPVSKRK